MDYTENLEPEEYYKKEIKEFFKTGNSVNMFKRFIIPGIFILLSLQGIGQRFEGGLLAGFNATQVEGDNFKGYHKPGILAGFFVQTEIVPAVFTGMEIKYSQKGSRNKTDPKDPDPEKYIMRLGYIDLPFYAGFRTSNVGAIVAGVSLGYLIHAREYNEYGEFPVEDQHDFNNFDLQPFLGFQFDFLERVSLDLRFALSVLPLRGQPGDESTSYYWLNNQFNNVISLALNYRLDY
ncbi:MAG: porin family protein [Prolixibacteraceae bacterium]|nr:porin family protein [Prolixibacteraceae bacterium]